MSLIIRRPNISNLIELECEHRLIVLAGPNGVGKSTIISELGTEYEAPRGLMGHGYQMPGAFSENVRLIPHVVTHRELKNYNITIGLSQPPNAYQTFGLTYEQFKAAMEMQNGSLEPDPLVKNLQDTINTIDREIYYAADNEGKWRTYLSYHTRLMRPELDRLTEVFYKYYHQYAALKYAGMQNEEIINDIGEPKWIEAQESLNKLGLDYIIDAPDIDKVLPTGGQFKLLRRSDGGLVPGDRMSTGERAALSLFDIIASDAKPNRIYVFDDIDGFLHAPLLKRFLILLEHLLEKQNSYSLWVTHSPVTVQLANKASFFYIKYYGASPAPIEKTALIQRLTGGTLSVLDNAVSVFAEGKDPAWYNTVLQALIFDGHISPKRAVKFISPNSSRDGGGASCDAVIDIVNILNQNGYNGVFRGLIDHDQGQKIPSFGVIKLPRYSIENYWFDPLNVFVFLLDNAYDRIPDPLRFAEIRVSHGNLIMTKLVQAQLQKIIDHYATLIAALAKDAGKFQDPKFHVIEDVDFIGGIVLKYPALLLRARGKDLLPLWKAIEPILVGDRLKKKFALGAFWPKDLLDCLAEFSER